VYKRQGYRRRRDQGEIDGVHLSLRFNECYRDLTSIKELRFSFSKRRGVVRKVIVFILLVCGIASSGLVPDLAGDWVGQMNGGFKVRLHFEKTDSGYSGKLINPSGAETVLDQVTSDGTHVHFAVNKLNLSFDGEWNEQEKGWSGNLTFQQVYPLILRRATTEDMGTVAHKRPQEDAINAGPAPYVQQEIHFANNTAHNHIAGTLSLPTGDCLLYTSSREIFSALKDNVDQLMSKLQDG